MEIRKVKINTEVAVKMLEGNETNRSLSKRHVDYLSRQMQEGLWKSENGDLIRFSKSKRLLDGQHRLAAIVKSGVTLDLYVAYNLDEDVFEFIDIGKTRHGGDVLQFAGIKNANHISRIIKTHTNLKRGLYSHDASGVKRLSNHEIIELYYSSPEKYNNAVRKGMALYGSFNRVLSVSNIAAYYLYFSEHNSTRADLFFEKLCRGLSIDGISDPVKRLRDKLTFAKLDKTKNITSKYLYVYMVKGWNYYIKNKEVKSISYNEGIEQFPKPLSY